MIHIIGNDEGSTPYRTLTRIDRWLIVCYAKGIIIDKEKKKMFHLDKQAIVKNARSNYKKTTSQKPTTNWHLIGVSDRTSLSKAGYKPTTGWSCAYRIKQTPFGEMRIKIKGARKSGACR